MTDMKTVITEEALKASGIDIAFEILEFHMEGETRVIDKLRVIEMSTPFLDVDDLQMDMSKIGQMDTSDWF